MLIWTDDVANQVLRALKNRRADKCPACGSLRVQLSSAFHAQVRHPRGYYLEEVTDKVLALDDDVYVKVTCLDCGFLHRHQMNRLGPLDLPSEDGLLVHIRKTLGI